MKDGSASTRQDATQSNSGQPETFANSSAGLSDRLCVWHLWLRSQEDATRNRSNNDYMTVVSHELRNSLSAIRTATGVLSLDIAAGLAAVKARTLIERQVTQMTRLVEDILDASRVRIGQLDVRCERVDLCAVVARALQTVEFMMLMRSHSLQTSFPGDAPVWLEADPVRLETVFVNLLLNAAKYTDLGGDIRLVVERQAGEAVVRVRDSGIGIEPAVLPQVFDLFFRANRSAERAEPGLGIGLALVRSLVERHGGLVTAESAGTGRGSEFTVRLPIAAQ
jgi:signal transduction histidine kinase